MRIVQPLRSWLIASHLLVLGLPLAVLIGTGALNQDLLRQTQGDLYNQGALLAQLVAREVAHSREIDAAISVAEAVAPLGGVLREARQTTLASIRVLDTDGVVIASSGAELGEDFSDREEVRGALEGVRSTAIRPRDDPSQRQPLAGPSRRARVRLYVAVPVSSGGEQLGVVLLSRTPREHIQALYQMAPSLGWGVAVALLITLALSLWAGWIGSRGLRALSGAAYRIAEGDWGAIGVLRAREDSHIAEVAGLARSFGHMSDRLRERLAYIREFAGNVAHEFRTPIATLRATVELLQHDRDLAGAQRARFLSNAACDLDRMDHLLGGLLLLARAEEGQGRAPLELAAIVERAADRYPEVHFEGTPGEVLGAAEQIESALGNLIENALHHGGEEVRVAVRAWIEGEWTGFDVVDDGPGISPNNLPHIFERFFTTDREGGGTGLGLAIVRAICQAHGGRVEVESRRGHTRFRIALPRS